MSIFFQPASHKAINGRWISYFFTSTVESEKSIPHLRNSLDVEFDSKEEADNNAVNFCLEQGYVLKN